MGLELLGNERIRNHGTDPNRREPKERSPSRGMDRVKTGSLIDRAKSNGPESDPGVKRPPGVGGNERIHRLEGALAKNLRVLQECGMREHGSGEGRGIRGPNRAEAGRMVGKGGITRP